MIGAAFVTEIVLALFVPVPDMRTCQSLRWVLTETEVARLAYDCLGGLLPWRGSEPWFVRVAHARSLRRNAS